MKTLLRGLLIAGATIVALVVLLLLYLSFGDLGRHKGQAREIRQPADESSVRDRWPTDGQARSRHQRGGRAGPHRQCEMEYDPADASGRARRHTDRPALALLRTRGRPVAGTERCHRGPGAQRQGGKQLDFRRPECADAAGAPGRRRIPEVPDRVRTRRAVEPAPHLSRGRPEGPGGEDRVADRRARIRRPAGSGGQGLRGRVPGDPVRRTGTAAGPGFGTGYPHVDPGVARQAECRGQGCGRPPVSAGWGGPEADDRQPGFRHHAPEAAPAAVCQGSDSPRRQPEGCRRAHRHRFERQGGRPHVEGQWNGCSAGAARTGPELHLGGTGCRTPRDVVRHRGRSGREAGCHRRGGPFARKGRTAWTKHPAGGQGFARRTARRRKGRDRPARSAAGRERDAGDRRPGHRRPAAATATAGICTGPAAHRRLHERRRQAYDTGCADEGGRHHGERLGVAGDAGLRDADLQFKAEALDAARLGTAFDVAGVPAAKVEVARSRGRHRHGSEARRRQQRSSAEPRHGSTARFRRTGSSPRRSTSTSRRRALPNSRPPCLRCR